MLSVITSFFLGLNFKVICLFSKRGREAILRSLEADATLKETEATIKVADARLKNEEAELKAVEVKERKFQLMVKQIDFIRSIRNDQELLIIYEKDKQIIEMQNKTIK